MSGVTQVSTEFRPECRDNSVPSPVDQGRRLQYVIVHKSLLLNTLSCQGGLTWPGEWYIITLTHMSQPTAPDPRKAALRATGALHPHPEAVQDEAFRGSEFFDPDDIVQVKYEMLRRHRVENKPVTDVARSFGASRQAFYDAEAIFDRQGIPGLVPKRRGPRSPHKCTDEVLDFAARWKDEHPEERTERVAEAIQQRFGLSINPRSIDRALARRKKKPTPPAEAHA